jgi:tRNA pseudouridine38-40 synthase
MGVSFTVPEKWSADALRRALNSLLPRDCWVERLLPMRPGFHARKSASGRRYRYEIGTDEAAASPFRRPYEWALGRPLDGDLLQEAASRVTGEHHFHAFAVRKEADGDHPYRCHVRLARWEPRSGGRGYSFHIAADRFLHHMVRFLVGTMVDIALGRRSRDDMAILLASTDNQATSPPAPPQGLYFVSAEYPAACYEEATEVTGTEATKATEATTAKPVLNPGGGA